MRFALVRLADDLYEFIWSYHHLLLDGWSMPIILSYLFSCYEAERRGLTLRVEAVRSYQEYIRWFKQQSMAEAEAYWRAQLSGFQSATPLGIERLTSDALPEEQGSDEVGLLLSEELTHSLKNLARQQELTLNTLLQGAWALLLSHYSGQDEVVFGTVVSGRPAEVVGVESMVGLFINTLPGRVRFSPEQPAINWLRALQLQQTEARQYEYSPLVQVQGWSEVPRGTSLFESLFVFENYPISNSAVAKEAGEASLQIQATHSLEQTNYPLTVVAMPGQRFSLKVLYDSARFDRFSVELLLKPVSIVL